MLTGGIVTTTAWVVRHSVKVAHGGCCVSEPCCGGAPPRSGRVESGAPIPAHLQAVCVGTVVLLA